MKIPKRAPDIQQLVKALATRPKGLEAVALCPMAPTHEGRYIHWQKLRFYPPPHGLTHEQWWLAMKAGRQSIARNVPLTDLGGTPFVFSQFDVVWEYLYRVDRDVLDRIKPADQPMADPLDEKRVIGHFLTEEAIASSQLEGASTTRRVAKDMIRSGRAPRDRSEVMIRNNYLAMQQIKRLTDKPLTQRIILDLHQTLTTGTMDDPSAVGRFRRPEELVRVYDYDDQVLHEPPPARELPARTAAMLDFANGKTPREFIHPVVRAIVLHFWLAYDHPFLDGNGRCARALFYWAMLKHGYGFSEYLSISQLIREAPAKYGRAFLYTETDGNDLTYFLLYHLDVIERAIKEFRHYVARKTREVRQTQRLIHASAAFNYRQLAVLSYALRHPDAEFTIGSHQTSQRVVHQTARMDLYDLADRGLLLKRKIGRTFHFYPAEDLETKLRQAK